jgi:hypothetical protein
VRVCFRAHDLRPTDAQVTGRGNVGSSFGLGGDDSDTDDDIDDEGFRPLRRGASMTVGPSGVGSSTGGIGGGIGGGGSGGGSGGEESRCVYLKYCCITEIALELTTVGFGSK